MKAAILNGYNKNGCELVLKEIPVPEFSSQEVLVKIRAAGVNPLDNMIIRGGVKLIVPYRFPLVMGNEFVGVIEKVGAEVSGFSVGDRVYGRMPLDKIGAFAEYAAMTKYTTRPWRDNTEQAASPRPGDPVWGWVFLRACRRPALLSAKVVSADCASDLSAVIYRKQVQNIMIKNEKLSGLIGDKEGIICYNIVGGIYTQTRITEMEGSP